MEDQREHYIYLHINSEKNEIFYVGLGKDKRAYVKSNRGRFWKDYISKYPNYEILICNKCLTFQEAKELEIIYIKIIGRRDLMLGTLVNLTDGGEGVCGYIVTKEHRKNLSIAHKNPSKEIRKK